MVLEYAAQHLGTEILTIWAGIPQMGRFSEGTSAAMLPGFPPVIC
jgi:hypothetical protein